MTEPRPDPLAGAAAAVPDWEAFYRDYRKPGYVEGFEITSKLGGGMFGLVFRARRMSIGKDYAIKFLKVDDVEVRRAIVSELEQVNWFAQIDHPNLVAIEDRGEVDGIPYLVMAFAGSETLRDRMPVDADGNGVRPTPEQKAELMSCFLQCCRGLSALHERGLVHFDLKPANVFLKGSVARLGDYGLSKLVTHSRGSLSMGRGTPYYMAPEMLQRRGDHRSDVYSLGVVLYELLCGAVPFRGDSEWAVLRAHEAEQPQWPSHLTQVERAVLQRCLQKDPGQRFQSVHDLIVALGGAVSVAAAGPLGGPLGEARVLPASSAAATEPSPPPLPGQRSHAEPTAPLRLWPLHEWSDARIREATRRAVKKARHLAKRASGEAKVVSQAAGRVAGEQGRRVAKQMRRSLRNGARRARPFVIGIGALVTCVAVLFAFLMAQAPRQSVARARGVVVSRTGPADAATPAGSAAVAPATAPRWSTSPLFSTYVVPSGFEQLVSTSEPRWAQLAASDPAQAKRLLLQHIERLRDRAPISAKARSNAAELPRFFELQPPSPQLVQWVEQLQNGRRYDAQLAARIVGRGPTGLAAAAEALERLEWSDAHDLDRARMLHRLLVEATACRDLELYDRSGSAEQLGRYNRPLGSLWRWFVNEFAGTERAWQTYRALLGSVR
ncbi:MAG: protein kinase [Planctomycetota bacterium]